MIDKKKIGLQLRELRLNRDWQQYKVADKVGLSRSAISNIEAGRRALTLSTLRRFCEIYNIDISYFGIETDSYDDLADLITRLELFFQSNLPEKQKDELFKKIMKMYLDAQTDN